MYRIRVDRSFHKRCKMEMRGALYNQPRGTRKGTKTTRKGIVYAYVEGVSVRNEGRAGAGLCDTAMHSRTHTQHTVHNKHTCTHQIPRACGTLSKHTEYTAHGENTEHTAGIHNTENSTQHRGRTPNAGTLVGRYRSISVSGIIGRWD